MAKVSETYSGKYLNAAELTPLGQRRRAVVHSANVEEIGEDKGAKIVLSLVNAKGLPWPKDMVLNKGNALQMAAAFGDDSDDWTGKFIDVWAENVMFQGKLVPGIKVQPTPQPPHAGNGAAALPPPQPPRPPVVASPPVPDDLDNAIPF